MSAFVETLLRLVRRKREPLEPILQLRRIIIEPDQYNDLALCLLYDKIKEIEYEEWVPPGQFEALKKTMRDEP